jgi:hypothetical protein
VLPALRESKVGAIANISSNARCSRRIAGIG